MFQDTRDSNGMSCVSVSQTWVMTTDLKIPKMSHKSMRFVNMMMEHVVKKDSAKQE